jgi:UDP-N-acetylmuramoyl-tripeptide--D-alanyl-D-alanine ligase
MIRPLWTSDAIAAATGGIASAPFAVSGVTFDSREILGGELFVAMHGAATDGHRFVGSAAARGAAGFLVEAAVEQPHVQVASTQAALEALGAAARARLAPDARVIGITGSVGKTGTKEALAAALARVEPEATHRSVKSYNNHTGVPLSLARMPGDTRFAVLEMGMNHAGEIAGLTRQVRPQIAAITWVANAHIEHFVDGEPGIARAKAEIFEGVEPGGTAIWPADNPHAAILRAKAEALGLRSLAFGESSSADVRLLSADIGPDGTDLVADVTGHILACRIGMAGRHWVNNALCVLASVHAADGDLAQAGLALADLADLPGRGARVRLALAAGEALLMDESYNANPASMAAALAVLAATPATRRLAILGAMKELGAAGPALHAGLAQPIAEAGIAELALVGDDMRALAVDGAAYLPDAEAALHWARAKLRPGDALLVKGSNSMGLARVVAGLRETRP